MPQLPRDDKDTGYAGDMPTSITSMRNMKSHLKRKMRMDEIHPDNVSDDEMTLVRKWLRRLDISDVESEGARKEVEANLNP